MSGFWPEGLELSDTQSPIDILNTAQEEWETNSEGVLQLVLQDAKSQSGHPMIIVHAKHVVKNRTARLFSIVHLPEKPYPVTIQPEKEDLPAFLKKSSPESTFLPFATATITSKMLGQNDRWISDTPSEFRKKLAEVFNLGIIKREILNLVSNTTDGENNTNQDLTEE